MRSSLRRPLTLFCIFGSASLALWQCGGGGTSDMKSSSDMSSGAMDMLVSQVDMPPLPPADMLTPFAFSYTTPAKASTMSNIKVIANGAGFVSGPSLGLSFGGKAATGVTYLSPTQVSLTLPSDPGILGKVDVTMTNGNGQTQTVKSLFSYYPSTGAFGTQNTFPAASQARSVVTGDFNSDGHLDMAVANGMANNVTVLLGKGDGTFGTAVPYTVGSYPYTIAAGDINGDKILDLVTANQQGNTVSVLLGQAGGTFATAQTVSLGTATEPQGVAVIDLNGDNKPDIVTGNLTSSNASVLLNQTPAGAATATFATAANVGVGAQPYALLVTDVSGDGVPDLITVNSAASSVTVLYGKGDGTFNTAFPYSYSTGAGSKPYAAVYTDLDGDGYAELILANNGTSSVAVLQGQPDHTFSATPAYTMAVGMSPEYIGTADFDGDGTPDLVTANFGASTATVMFGAGVGMLSFNTARTLTLTTGTSPNWVGIGDVNGDNKLDLLVTNFGANNVGVLLNTSQ